METKTLSGHTITRFEGKELEDLRKEFPGELHHIGWLSLNPGNITVPPYFDKIADKIYQLKFKESDIIVNTCPKSGTTWVQEIIWTMKNNPNLDNPKANLSQGMRSPMLELDSYTEDEGPYMEVLFEQVMSIMGEGPHLEALFAQMSLGMGDLEKGGMFLKFLDILPNPRIIKTHLPISLLPPDILDSTKLVYVARNPYDVCLSTYHFSRLLKGLNYSGTFEQFAKRFMAGKMLDLPFWEHVYEAWKKKNHPNLHFIFYENLKKDPYAEILRLNTFLETNLTDEQLKNVTDFTSFSEMKKRGVMAFGVVETKEQMNMDLKEKEGGFLRKGIVGDWKNCSDKDTINSMKKWIDDNMKDMDIPFIYEINPRAQI